MGLTPMAIFAHARKEGLKPMKFPVFVQEKDSSRLIRFSSVYEMQSYLEAIDIENHEYSAWDADGTALELGTQKPVWITVEEGTNDWGGLIKSLCEFAVLKGIEVKKEPSSSGEIEALLESIAVRKS
jgi:hypothetical protein